MREEQPVSTVSAKFASLAVALVASLFIIAAVFGTAGAFLPPVIYSLPVRILGEKKASEGFGVINTCMNLGILLGPVFVGVVADVMYEKGILFSTMGGLAIVSLFLCLGLGKRIRY